MGPWYQVHGNQVTPCGAQQGTRSEETRAVDGTRERACLSTSSPPCHFEAMYHAVDTCGLFFPSFPLSRGWWDRVSVG